MYQMVVEVLKTRVLAGGCARCNDQYYPDPLNYKNGRKRVSFEDLSNKDYLKRVKNGCQLKGNML